MILNKAINHGDHAPQEIPLGDGEHGVKTMSCLPFLRDLRALRGFEPRFLG